MIKKLFLMAFLVGFLSLVGLRVYEQLAPGDAVAGAAAGRGGPGGGRGGPSLLVEKVHPEYRTFQDTLEVLGELKAQASVEVMSRLNGRLRQVLWDRGDFVRQGELIAVVDDDELRQQIRRAEAAVEVARAGQAREQATRDNLKLQLERYRELHEEALISTQDFQDAESRVRIAQSQLALAEAQLEQAEASLEELKIRLEYTRIYAPLGGHIGMRHLDPGALVNPSLPIVSILSLDRVKTVVPVTETTLSKIRVGLPTQISVDASPGKTYSGSVSRVSPYVNPETRTADVEIEIPNPNRTLKAGMFARVGIDISVSREALAISRSALLTRGTAKGVYRLDQDQVAVFQRIEIGRIQGDFVEVLSGLEPGIPIIGQGAQNVNEGDRVRVSDERHSARRDKSGAL